MSSSATSVNLRVTVRGRYFGQRAASDLSGLEWDDSRAEGLDGGLFSHSPCAASCCFSIQCQAMSKSDVGFGLIELTVAMALGLLLVLGMTQIFLSARGSYLAQGASAQLQEDGYRHRA